jgi:hypothetical protein
MAQGANRHANVARKLVGADFKIVGGTTEATSMRGRSAL